MHLTSETGPTHSSTKISRSGCIVENNRPIFLKPLNAKSLDVAQMGETLYYFSAGFLTFKQSDFISCLIADRPLLRLQCRVAARVTVMTVSDAWKSSSALQRRK